MQDPGSLGPIANELFRFGPTLNHALYKTVEAQRLLDALPHPRGLVLDLACGNGTFTTSLRDHFHAARLIGLDRDEADLRKAARQNAHRGFVRADARDLPFPSGVFDLVISICAIEHMQGAQKVMNELFRTLKSGGRLFFTVPSEFFIEYQWPAKLLPDPLRARWIKNRTTSYGGKIVDIALPLDRWMDRVACSGFHVRQAGYYLNRTQAFLWSAIGSLESLPLVGRVIRRLPRRPVLGLLAPVFQRVEAQAKGAGVVILAEKPGRPKR